MHWIPYPRVRVTRQTKIGAVPRFVRTAAAQQELRPTDGALIQ